MDDTTARRGADVEYGILVHSHLRWDFVWQRPQHVLSRLSRFHPVVFVEPWKHLPQREAELMAAADVVFTGGPSLQAARQGRHSNLHQFNSGVDVAHFRRAL